MRKLLVLLMCGSLPGWGWGPEGHSLVARIAWAQMTPAAQAKASQILGPGVSLPSIASWADQARTERKETGPWHYVDIPIDKPHLDMARDCPKGDCILTKIEEFRKQLGDPAITPVKRKEALMFIVHFVGDMHQPLHCSDNGDKGGNDVQVKYGNLGADRPYNLHSLWDSGLLGKMAKEDELFAIYSPESAAHARKWSKGTVEDWAEEAHRKSVKVTYGKLPKVAPKTAITIDAKYEQKADKMIREQIERAGARLAHVLNEALQ